MKLTAEEKKLVLDHRRKEEQKKPVKTGILKHDLYYSKFNGQFFTSAEVEEEIEEFKNSFVLTENKGNIFECYLDEDVEEWYDTASGAIEVAPAEWAQDHLENIKPVKKSRKKE